MSKVLIEHDLGDYIFIPSTRQVVIVGTPSFEKEQITLILNALSNKILYNFADESLNGSLAGNTLTLNYDTTSMGANDGLLIYMDFPSTAIVDQASMNEAYTHLLLQRICDLLEPMATQDAANRQRVSVDAITATLANVTTVGTVSTITGGTISTITNAIPVGNIATIGGGNPEWQYIDIARTAYDTLRSKLVFGD